MNLTDQTNIHYTWRITRPINRDAVCLQIFRYEWDDDGHKQAMLMLDSAGEPYWMEYAKHSIIPDATVEFNGLDLMYLFGNWPGPRDALPNFDPRIALERKIEAILKDVIEKVMVLEPAVEFDEKG